jgi:TM2 domain-containing membrane protein YozV
MIYCVDHPEREASGMCVFCGKPFCEECLLQLDGKMHCKQCAQELFYTLRSSSSPAVVKPPAPPQPSRTVAMILCLFLGLLGVHRFYLGHNTSGGVILALDLIFCWTVIVPVIIALFCLGDFISIITGGLTTPDGKPLAR